MWIERPSQPLKAGQRLLIDTAAGAGRRPPRRAIVRSPSSTTRKLTGCTRR
jgi:hypothetical protein